MTSGILPRLMEMGPKSGKKLKNAQKNLIGKSCKVRRRKDLEKYAKMHQKWSQKSKKNLPKIDAEKIVKIDLKKGRS